MPKRIITNVGFAATDEAGLGSATFVDFPRGKILLDNSSPYGVEMQSAELLGGGNIESAADGTATYALRLEPGVDALSGVRTALAAGDPVYLRETYADGSTLTAGPCFGGFALPSSGRGTFLVETLTLTVPAASTADAFTLAAGA